MAFLPAGGLWALLFRALLVCTGVGTGPRPTAGLSPGLHLPAVRRKGRRSLTDSLNFLWQPTAGLQAARLQLKRPCRRLFGAGTSAQQAPSRSNGGCADGAYEGTGGSGPPRADGASCEGEGGGVSRPVPTEL